MIIRIQQKIKMIHKIIVMLVFLNFVMVSRSRQIFQPKMQDQGDGAKVFRVIGGQSLQKLDPFLMLDYFNLRLPAGFPDHPHRGFETVTYMKRGTFYHEDFKGHKGIIRQGDVQWMTAGRGIIHAEMPGSFEEDSIGFQLWLNLKSEHKLKEPIYQQYKSTQIETINMNDTVIKLICGELEGKKGVIEYSTPALFLDIELHPNQNNIFQLQIEKGWNSLVYVYDGEISYYSSSKNNKDFVKNMNVCVLDKQNQFSVLHTFQAKSKSRFMLLSGLPLNEAVYSYGPFVMNTRQQINQAFDDFRNSKNGFQGSRQWSSKIKNMKSKAYFEQL